MEHGGVVPAPAGHVGDARHAHALETPPIERPLAGQSPRPVDHRFVDVGQIVEGFPGHLFLRASLRLVTALAADLLIIQLAAAFRTTPLFQLHNELRPRASPHRNIPHCPIFFFPAARRNASGKNTASLADFPRCDKGEGERPAIPQLGQFGLVGMAGRWFVAMLCVSFDANEASGGSFERRFSASGREKGRDTPRTRLGVTSGADAGRTEHAPLTDRGEVGDTTAPGNRRACGPVRGPAR